MRTIITQLVYTFAHSLCLRRRFFLRQWGSASVLVGVVGDDAPEESFSIFTTSAAAAVLLVVLLEFVWWSPPAWNIHGDISMVITLSKTNIINGHLKSVTHHLLGDIFDELGLTTTDLLKLWDFLGQFVKDSTSLRTLILFQFVQQHLFHPLHLA